MTKPWALTGEESALGISHPWFLMRLASDSCVGPIHVISSLFFSLYVLDSMDLRSSAALGAESRAQGGPIWTATALVCGVNTHSDPGYPMGRSGITLRTQEERPGTPSKLT